MGWRLLNNRQALWGKILWAKYGTPLANTPAPSNASYLWKSIRHAQSILKAGSQALDEDQNSPWDQDTPWTWGGSPRFSMGLACELQNTPPDEHATPKWRRIWETKGPQGGNMLIWQIRHKKLLTAEILNQRGILDLPQCNICNRDAESTLHAVRGCQWISNVWKLLNPKEKWNSFFKEKDVKKWIDWNLNERAHEKILGCAWSYLFRDGIQRAWYWRNQVLQKNIACMPYSGDVRSQVCQRVKHLQYALQCERDEDELRWKGDEQTLGKKPRERNLGCASRQEKMVGRGNYGGG